MGKDESDEQQQDTGEGRIPAPEGSPENADVRRSDRGPRREPRSPKH